MGSQSRCHGDGQPLLHDDRGAPSGMAQLGEGAILGEDVPARHRRNTGVVPLVDRQLSECGWRGYGAACIRVPADRSGRAAIAARRARARRHRHPDGIRPGPSGHGAGSLPGRDRGASPLSHARRNLPGSGSAPRRGRLGRPESAGLGICAPRRPFGSPAAKIQQVHSISDEGAWRSRRESLRSAPGNRARNQQASSAHDQQGPGHSEDGSMAFRRSTSICTCRTTPLRQTTRRPSICWRGSLWTCPSRIRSSKRETGSSTCFCGCRPSANRAGDILLADSTIFTTLFGGDESLETFWKNLATR